MTHRQNWIWIAADSLICFLFFSSFVWATTEYTCLTGKSCSFCHENPNGGGILTSEGEDYPAYPDLLTFYDTNTKIELILYEMFMDHRMKTFQGAFHMNYDYSTWYGYAKMKKI